jgi:hypothetical protein
VDAVSVQGGSEREGSIPSPELQKAKEEKDCMGFASCQVGSQASRLLKGNYQIPTL